MLQADSPPIPPLQTVRGLREDVVPTVHSVAGWGARELESSPLPGLISRALARAQIRDYQDGAIPVVLTPLHRVVTSRARGIFGGRCSKVPGKFLDIFPAGKAEPTIYPIRN